LRSLYSILVYLLLPLVLLYLLLKSVKQPEYRRGISQRLGLSGSESRRPVLWLHGASVGEIVAATPLIRRLLDLYPDRTLLVTTVTPTGAERVRDTFGGRVLHCYLPLDAGFAVRSFIHRYQPQLAIIIETEIWPNLYMQLDAANVPVIIASARLSQRSVDGYGRFRSLIEAALAGDVTVAAQTEADADRFQSLGVAASRVSVTGNLKFDFAASAEVMEQGQLFRNRHGAEQRPVWIAASTHSQEEDKIIAAHKTLLTMCPQALLLLVPRHPERFDEVAGIIRKSGLSSIRRSSNQICDPNSQVLLGDSMGELMMYYAAADVAFVGGSLVNVGGHNLLEPAALGMPVLSGPAVQNAPDVAAMLVGAGGLQLVADSDELAARLGELFARPSSREELGKRALRAMQKNGGALDRTLLVIEAAVGQAS
jgi:3-deoxy-D-manno-octulosonic-acid transferase